MAKISNHFDTIVLGLGGMGAAATWACTQRHHHVLGIEQFDLVHALGSSHGQSRIIREAYYEHPAYVPLVREAFQRWRELEQRAQIPLLTRCDCANIGRPTSEIVQGVERAAAEHHLSVERWNADQIRTSIPALSVPDDYVALVEANAGWIKVESAVHSCLRVAQSQGATLHAQERVISWTENSSHVEVITDKDTYTARHLIISAGPWAGQVLSGLELPLRVMRQLQLWFTPPEKVVHQFSKRLLPIFMVDTSSSHFYGIPTEAGDGVKIAQHYGQPELNSPQEIHRQITDADIVPIRKFLTDFMPDLASAPLASSAVCIYTLSPDRHFIIDRHPHHGRVALACGFSGHGFKFAPVVGEMLADLLEGKERLETQSLFSISRFL